MIVVDTNILAHLFFDGERTGLARAVYQKDQALVAPTLWRHEFINLLTMYVRFKGLEAERAVSIWNEALYRLAESEFQPETRRIIQTAEAYKLSSHDAQFIALAMERGVFCITEDKELLKNCPELAISMEDFLGDSPSTVRGKESKYSTKGKARPIPPFKAYKGKFSLTSEFVGKAKREGRR